MDKILMKTDGSKSIPALQDVVFKTDTDVQKFIAKIEKAGEPIDRFLRHSADDLNGSPFTSMTEKKGLNLTPPEIKAIKERVGVLGNRVIMARIRDVLSREEATSAISSTARVIAEGLHDAMVVETAENETFMKAKLWPGLPAADWKAFKEVREKIENWHEQLQTGHIDQNTALRPYDEIVNSANAMSAVGRNRFFCKVSNGFSIPREDVLNKYASYPMYVSLVALTHADSEQYAAAVQYLQCNESILQHLCDAVPHPMPKDTRPSWWNKQISDAPKYVVTKRQLVEMRAHAAINGVAPTPKDLETITVMTMHLQLAVAVLLSGSVERCLSAWQLLSADKAQAIAPQKSLDHSVLCVDATHRRLPHDVMQDIAAALQAYRDIPQLRVDAPEQYKLLSELYAQGIELDSESRAQGEQNARVIYLCAHDATLMNLSQQASECISALEPTIKSLRNQQELLESEARSAAGPGRKARRTAAKNRKLSSTLDGAQVPSASVAQAWEDVVAPIPLAYSAVTTQENTPTEDAGYPTHVHALPHLGTPRIIAREPKRLSELLRSLDTLGIPSPNAPIQTVTLGGVRLPTRLPAERLSQLMSFVGAATFEKLTWLRYKSQFDMRLSPAAHALNYHIGKHFPQRGGESAASSQQMTAEKYIRGALQVAQSGFEDSYFVPSAADASKKVRKFRWGGYFAILGLDNRVISYGFERGPMC
ncbi:MAG: hypothetical protein EOO38_02715 [Cytophagaceae bacterium]|nr:MAG: hypothetical protein EOO38_02715 [Cytophagaceae bacterium]